MILKNNFIERNKVLQFILENLKVLCRLEFCEVRGPHLLRKMLFSAAMHARVFRG